MRTADQELLVGKVGNMCHLNDLNVDWPPGCYAAQFVQCFRGNCCHHFEGTELRQIGNWSVIVRG
jgi:hypothetical protein